METWLPLGFGSGVDAGLLDGWVGRRNGVLSEDDGQAAKGLANLVLF
jgi:hypothetical protein